jgi:hypothetical protein
LLNAHVPVDLLPRADNLTRYKLLILADQVTLDPAEVAAIEAVVAQGGALLVIGGAGALNDDGSRQDGPLDGILGIETEGRAGWPFAYLRLADGTLTDGISDVPILVNRDPHRVAVHGAEVLGELSPPETGRTVATTVLWGNPPPNDSEAIPGVTLHQHGRGRALFIACSLAGNRTEQTPVWDTRGLEDAWLQRLIQNATRLLLPSPLLETDLPPGVHLTLNNHDGTLAIHLLDTRLAEPEHIAFGDQVAPAAGWTLRLNWERAGPITAIRTLNGQPVAWASAGDAYVVQLPPIGLHSVLILENGG